MKKSHKTTIWAAFLVGICLFFMFPVTASQFFPTDYVNLTADNAATWANKTFDSNNLTYWGLKIGNITNGTGAAYFYFNNTYNFTEFNISAIWLTASTACLKNFTLAASTNNISYTTCVNVTNQCDQASDGTYISYHPNVTCTGSTIRINVTDGGSYGTYIYEINYSNNELLENLYFFDTITKAVVNNITLTMISDTNTTIKTTTTGALNLAVPNATLILFRYNSTDYLTGYYYVNITNLSYSNNYINLYIQPAATGSNITATVYDNNNNLVEDVYIKALRYFPLNNSYVMVSSVKTDSQGTGILPLEKYAEFYKFILEYPFGNTVLTTTPALIINDNLNFHINLNTLPGVLFNQTVNIQTAGINFDNTTGEFSITYSNVEGATSTVYLQVSKVTSLKKSLLNSTSLTASAGSIVTSITPSNDTVYLAQAYVVYTDNDGSTVNYLIDSYSYEYTNKTTLGPLGIFLVIILTCVVMFIGYFSLAGAIILLPTPLLIAALLGLVPFSFPLAIVLQIAAFFAAEMVGF